MTLVRPPHLRAGDTIAFLAPSAGLAAFTSHRLERAKTELESYGYRVKIYNSVTCTPSENMMRFIQESESLDPQIYHDKAKCYGSADPQTRAQDLMDAFTDPEVRAIVCTIGGLNCHELFEYLDFDVIRAHPKIFTGFSDISSLHLAFQAQAKMVSFYGPSALCQFGEFPGPLPYTMEYFWKAVASSAPIGIVTPSTEWTDDKTANWFTKADIEYVDKMKANSGYVWLRQGQARGPILGGCLPVLLNVRGTQYMPDFQDAILLLETPEGHQFDQPMPLEEINMVLGALRIDGTFHKIKGLVIGRVFAHTPENVQEICRLVLYHTRGTSFPIVYGVDVGHTNPIATIPLGCQVSLDSTTNTFAIEEAGVC